MTSDIVHIEIPVKNLQSAKEFYEKIFDWKIEIIPGFDDYAFFTTSETGVGGAFERSDTKVAKGEIMLHIETENIPNTLETIVKAGGKIVKEKTEIGNEFGFYAVFEDIFGNVLGLWSKK